METLRNIIRENCQVKYIKNDVCKDTNYYFDYTIIGVVNGIPINYLYSCSHFQVDYPGRLYDKAEEIVLIAIGKKYLNKYLKDNFE
jgi:hypothetical protein